jgi:hypothetical protein
MEARTRRLIGLALALLMLSPLGLAQTTTWTMVAWNDLGMHCMDRDFGVFAILPPFNVFHAQLVDSNGQLVDPPPAGVTVSYEGTADPAGSINTTSVGKTNFWDHVQALFGVALPPDQGLAGYGMPGAANTPQSMAWTSAAHWWSAEGVPITPTDDAARKNHYPLMRLVARGSSGQLLAEAHIVLPVSDEMDCSTCHASGADPAAEPPAGWVWDPDPERDVRLNVLRLHDGLDLGDPAYVAALEAAGYSSAGLYANVVGGDGPILCARCHGSNALPGTGLAGVEPLTRAVHSLHANVVDPLTGQTLDAATNRSACYRCHPGSTTRCLRGAMGKAVAADGSMAMQCQGCHGVMSRVGNASRVGWLEQPACQSCHTGTATHNNGQIRYTTVFEANGAERQAVDATFATNPDVPAAGFDLFRFSYGHGGLACEACHGSTHAEFPSFGDNDNLESIGLQGHAGVISECVACHRTVPQTINGGPHGLHPLGQSWVSTHPDVAQGNLALCQSCHGGDYRATVLSASQADRTLSTPWGAKHFWRGYRISCYACHNGPTSENQSPHHPATVLDASAATEAGTPVDVALIGTDPDGDPLEFRVVSQARHGTVGWSGATATYHPDPDFVGTDSFTFAAWDGWVDSNLGTATVTVSDSSCQTAGCLFVDGFETGDTSRWSAAVP